MNLYIIRNKEGKFLKTGHGLFRERWKEELKDAKFYTKLGTAKAQVTFWYKNYPEFGCPDILEFSINEENATVLSLKEEMDKKIRNIEIQGLKRDIKYCERYNYPYINIKGKKTYLEELKHILKSLQNG